MTGPELHQDAAGESAGRGGAAGAASQTAAGLRVAVVLSTATGGTALHAGMLAEGVRRAGAAVLALGPAATRDAFAAAAASVPRAGAGGGSGIRISGTRRR